MKKKESENICENDEHDRVLCDFVPNPDSLYRDIVRHSGVPLLIADSFGRVKEVNDAFTAAYGYAQSEVAGLTTNFLDPGRDAYLGLGFTLSEYDAIVALILRVFRDASCREWEGSVLVRRRDLSLAWCLLHVSGLFAGDGTFVGVVGFFVDITSIHENEANGRVQIYRMIASLAELRDDDTGNHMKRVGLLTNLIAQAIGMDAKFCKDIEIFAPLHDIGKVGISDSILRARRRLTAEEMEIMRGHALLGHNIVKGKREFEMAADITLSHHEHIDGSGYPRGLVGSQIPLAAQITSVADVYDALRSCRPYKQAWTHESALQHLQSLAGVHFNPEIVAYFVLESNRVEEVYRTNPDS
jgi:PAS domain S-box-containing protein